MSVNLSGAEKGTLISSPAPAGFRIDCLTISKPSSTWVSHNYGELSGQTWLVTVQVNTFQGAGSYKGSVEIGELASSGSHAIKTYFGAATVAVAADKASSTFSGTLQPVPAGGASVKVRGSVSCVKATSPS